MKTSLKALTLGVALLVVATAADAYNTYGGASPLGTVSAGASSGGSGSGTVNAGTTPQVAYYAANGDAVSGNAALQFPATEVVVNESGLSTMDFRVEGDTDANTLFVDASADKVGFGTATPSYKISVVGAADQTIGVQATATNAVAQFLGQSDSFYYVQRANGSTIASTFLGTSDASWYTWQNVGGNGLKIGAGETGDQLLLGSFEPALGTTAVRTTLNNDEMVVNDPGNDFDFRVEGDTNANLIFADASADAVGIGTASPTAGEMNVNLVALGTVFSTNGNSGVFTRNTSATAASSSGFTAANGTHLAQYLLTSPSYTNGGTDVRNGGTTFLFSNAPKMAFVSANPIVFQVSGGGLEFSTTIERFRLGTAETVINEPGNNYDFRVEGDTNVNAFVVDASTDSVGVGGFPAASTNFHVQGNVNSLVRSVTSNASAGASAFALHEVTGDTALANARLFAFSSGNTNLTFGLSNANAAAWFAGTGASRMVIAAQGTTAGIEMGTASDTQSFRSLVLGANAGPVVVNEDSGTTIDFRVEGDTTPNLFFVDAGLDAIGINNSLPASALAMRQATSGVPDAFQLPSIISTAPTLPQCTVQANAGRSVYVDDTDDALAGGECGCNATAAGTYGWTYKRDDTLTCP